MNAEIICVGTELLLGDIVNTNAWFISQQLSSLGIAVYNQQVVGDNPERLKQAAELAKSRSDIVIYTGGLGPTDDDLTKQTIAQVYNDTLVFSQEICDKIESYFTRMGKPMTENNLSQAYIPQKGRVIENYYGTAPGIVFVDGEKMAVLMPGVPREMKPMMENKVVPMLSNLVNGTIVSRYIKTIGIGESALEEKVKVLLNGINPTAALYAKGGEVTIRITSHARDKERAETMLDSIYRQFDSLIHDYIYGVDVENIETVLVNKLKETGKTVATAESCTGGGLSSRITSVPGASSVFSLGVCTYSDRQKHRVLNVPQEDLQTYTAVSSPVVCRMAKGVLEKSGADYAIATTGYRGPDGGTPQEPVGTVYIAVATKQNIFVKKFMFTGNRERITHLACQNAFDLFRCVMDNIDIEAVRIFDNNHEEETEDEEESGAKGFLKGFFTMLMLIALSAALAAGYLWFKNSGTTIAGFSSINIDFAGIIENTGEFIGSITDTITDFFNKESMSDIGAVLYERKNNDFFSQGFEQSTLKTVKSLKAQNPDFEALLTFRYSAKEYAVAKVPNQQDFVNIYSGAIYGYRYIQGFTEDNFIDFTNLETARNNSGFMLFTDKCTDYQVFAVGTFSSRELEELKGIANKQEYIVQVRARSLFDVDVMVRDDDEIIALVQQLEGDKFIVSFAVKGNRSIFPSVDIKTAAVYSDWYMQENDLTDELFRDAVLYAQEIYDRDNWLSQPVIVEDPYAATPTPSVTPKEETKPTASPTSETISTATPKPTVVQLPTAMPVITAKPMATPEPIPTTETTATPTVTPVADTTQRPQPTAIPTPIVTPNPTSIPVTEATPPHEITPTPTPVPDNGEEILTVTMNGQVVSGPASQILSQIVAIEMTWNWNPQALKAQAIAAHTYLEYQYSRGVTAPAVAGRTSPNQKVIDSVTTVADLVMTVSGHAVYTPYTASAAGRTNPASQVWGTHHSHLVSVESKYDYQSTGYEKVYTISAEEMKSILDARIGTDLNLEKAAEWFTVVDYTDGGYVRRMDIDGVRTYTSRSGNTRNITGWYFASDILADAGYKLRSAAFDIAYADGNFTITTRSYGHGVGMSQWGAQLYAQNEGWNYEQILKHYYTGVDIVSWK